MPAVSRPCLHPSRLLVAVVLVVATAGVVTPAAADPDPAPAAPERIGYLRWSTSTYPSESQVVTVAPDGTDPVVVIDEGHHGAMDFSPDGTRLAVERQEVYWGGDQPAIWIVDVDGANLVNLTGGEVPGEPFTKESLPRWSPDGTRIAFEYEEWDADGNTKLAGGIAVMDADGTDVVRLTEDGGLIFGLSWSPDGTQIAYDRYIDSVNRSDIHVVAADGSAAPVNITDSTEDEKYPDWSPDGSRILYGLGEVATVAVDGTDRTTVLEGGADMPVISPTGPRWSPDGSQIVFYGTPGGEEGWHPSIWTVAADGTGLTAIADDPDGLPLEYPAWQRTTGTISGAVIDQASTDLLEGICVDLFDTAGTPAPVATHRTSADGTYTITGVAAGTYLVRFSDCASGRYAEQWYHGVDAPEAARPVTVTAGSVSDQISGILSRSPSSAAMVAVQLGADVDVVRADGTGQRPFLLDAADVAWSPDGTQVAFTEEPADTGVLPQVWVAAWDGTGLRQLTTSGGREPTWSPDGTRIAYARVVGEFADTDLYAVDVAGGEAAGLTQLTDDAGSETSPAWEPFSGDRIAYTHSDGPASDVRILNLADLSTELVLAGSYEPSSWSTATTLVHSPAWRHDGSRLALVQQWWIDYHDSPYDSYGSNIVTTAGPGAAPYVIQTGRLFNPSWSPDGTRIAVAANQYCTAMTTDEDGGRRCEVDDRSDLSVIGDLVVMAADGSRPRRVPVAVGDHGVTDVAWQPILTGTTPLPGAATDLALTTDTPHVAVVDGDQDLGNNRAVLTFSVTNQGGEDAPGVVVEVPLTPKSVLVSSSAGAADGVCRGERHNAFRTGPDTTVLCHLGEVPAGQAMTLRLEVNPWTHGTFERTASVWSLVDDLDAGDDTVTFTTEISDGVPLTVHVEGLDGARGSVGTAAGATPSFHCRDGGGTVGTCTEGFAAGTELTLTPSADAWSTFAGWSGTCSGTEPCTVVLDDAVELTATFVPAVRLSVTGGGSGTGSIIDDGGDIVCEQPSGWTPCYDDHTYQRAAEATVTLTATPDDGSAFTGWTGDCADADGLTCAVVMDGDRTVGATFTNTTVTLSTQVLGGGSGRITAGADVLCDGAACAGYTPITSGTPVTLTADPDEASTFAGWGGDCVHAGTAATCELTPDADVSDWLSVWAAFEPTDDGSDVPPLDDPADLVVSQVDDVDPVDAGGRVTYTVTVTNDGPGTATDVQVDDEVAGGELVTVTPDQGSCDLTGPETAICDLGDLAPGAAATIQVVATATTDPTMANMLNLVNASWLGDEADWSDNGHGEATDLRHPDPPGGDHGPGDGHHGPGDDEGGVTPPPASTPPASTPTPPPPPGPPAELECEGGRCSQRVTPDPTGAAVLTFPDALGGLTVTLGGLPGPVAVSARLLTEGELLAEHTAGFLLEALEIECLTDDGSPCDALQAVVELTTTAEEVDEALEQSGSDLSLDETLDFLRAIHMPTPTSPIEVGGPCDTGGGVITCSIDATSFSPFAIAVPATLMGGGGDAVVDLPDATQPSSGSDVAIRFAQLAFPEGVDEGGEVLLASETVFADALASGPLQADRPLLLTDPERLEQEVLDEIRRLGTATVRILGGTAAVSDAVEEALSVRGVTVERTAGPTRVETAIAIAELAGGDRAMLARAYGDGEDATRAFADSLAAGGWAAASRRPVLLTETAALSTSTAGHLTTARLAGLEVIGGTAAVAEEVVGSAAGMVGDVTRVSGLTRFSTAAAIAAGRGLDTPRRVILVDGQHAEAWTAGFSAAATSARMDAPILLANGDDLPEPTRSVLAQVQAAEEGTVLFCAASPAACATAADLIGLDPPAGP